MDEQEYAVWLYDGLPDHIGLSVRDATPMDGGYVVVFELDTGEIRMLATRFPAKYVASWKSNARRYGGGVLKRVLVSKSHPRYEKMKRVLAEMLAEDEGEAPPTIELVLEKARKLFPAKVHISNGEKAHVAAVAIGAGWAVAGIGTGV